MVIEETGIVSPSFLKMVKGIISILAHDKMYRTKEAKNNKKENAETSRMIDRGATSNQCSKPEIKILHHVPISTA